MLGQGGSRPGSAQSSSLSGTALISSPHLSLSQDKGPSGIQGWSKEGKNRQGSSPPCHEFAAQTRPMAAPHHSSPHDTGGGHVSLLCPVKETFPTARSQLWPWEGGHVTLSTHQQDGKGKSPMFYSLFYLVPNPQS